MSARPTHSRYHGRENHRATNNVCPIAATCTSTTSASHRNPSITLLLERSKRPSLPNGCGDDAPPTCAPPCCPGQRSPRPCGSRTRVAHPLRRRRGPAPWSVSTAVSRRDSFPLLDGSRIGQTGENLSRHLGVDGELLSHPERPQRDLLPLVRPLLGFGESGVPHQLVRDDHEAHQDQRRRPGDLGNGQAVEEGHTLVLSWGVAGTPRRPPPVFRS